MSRVEDGIAANPHGPFAHLEGGAATPSVRRAPSIARRERVEILESLIITLSEMSRRPGEPVHLSVVARSVNLAYDRLVEHLKPLEEAGLVSRPASPLVLGRHGADPATASLTPRGYEFLRASQDWRAAVKRAGLSSTHRVKGGQADGD